MIEHAPWIGMNYQIGISGQRICIVGHSHHHSGPDREDFTIDIVYDFISGELKRNSFFPQIKGYFEILDDATFWNRVMFFNFLPDCIGSKNERYGAGTTEQLARGKERFLRIIRETKPNLEKVFVFTTKGWRNFPRTIEEVSGKGKIPLSSEFPEFSWGTYAVGDHIVMAFGLRHPQGARGEVMKSAVRQILDKPLKDI